MDFSPKYLFAVAAAAAPMPLNRETTGTTGKVLMIYDLAVNIYDAMEGGGVRT